MKEIKITESEAKIAVEAAIEPFCRLMDCTPQEIVDSDELRITFGKFVAMGIEITMS